jgi:hypothetical protein
MTPEEMIFGFAYLAILFGGGALFIIFLFAIGVLLGLTTIDIWNIQEYPKLIKILLSVGLVFFPGIGVMSWVVYFGRSRKLIFRIIAFVISGLYLLLQLTPLLVKENGLSTRLIGVATLGFIWLPFILGGVASFFVLRALFFSKSVSSTVSTVQ